MKAIAFYLPQFHEIPENNDAWGNGFTEWVNVRKSIPLFEGHNQPRKPLNENYYNLLQEGVMNQQAELAKRYGLYGFCFYHYWFNGRMVLEKPIANFLKDKSIDFHYCFAWANEPWTKTWHGAGGEREILLAQTYGAEVEWEKHYEYFREYFLDDRYIKENNKPVLLIYRLKNIPAFNQMIRYWNRCAKRDGLDGIYIVSMNSGREHVDKSIWVNASVDFEPNYTKSQLTADNGRADISIIDYDMLYENMLKSEHGEKQFRTVFVDYDDTPRRGSRGILFKGSTPEKFGKYLEKSIELSKSEGKQYIFLNAWNEWGEGNYLEPDVKWEYRYLEEVERNMKVYKD